MRFRLLPIVVHFAGKEVILMASMAPGSVKLFGEHAVVYDRVGVSASLDKYANVRVMRSETGNIEMRLPDLNFSRTVGEKELMDEHREVSIALSTNPKLVDERRKADFSLPFTYILGSAFLRSKFTPLRIEITSDVPKHSGLGSSSAIFTALANELNTQLKLGLSIDGVADLANAGDTVVHGKPSGIDVSTCAHGGFLRFRKGEGVTPLCVGARVPVVIANTLVKKDTGEMIARVAKAYASDRSGVDEIFDDMQEAAFAGMDALQSGDMVKLGAEFDRTQACFKRLGLSTKETDEIIAFARKNKAYGAKITGAGGGGCVLILAQSPAKLIPLINKLGYPAFEATLGVEGVRHQKIG